MYIELDSQDLEATKSNPIILALQDAHRSNDRSHSLTPVFKMDEIGESEEKQLKVDES